MLEQIFTDEATTIEDILREKGQSVRRGSVGEDGDVEFWDEEEIARRKAREMEQQERVQIPNGS